MLHSFKTDEGETVTLPSRDYAEALEALLHAETRCLVMVVEIDCGTVTVAAHEAREHWDELAPGESFTVEALMTVEEWEAQQDAEAEAMAADAAPAAGTPSMRGKESADEVLAEFASHMGSICDGATHLTCPEADSVAAVLRVSGYPEVAERFLNFHAAGDDDPDDLHRDRETAPALAR